MNPEPIYKNNCKYYPIDGQELASVTSILGKVLTKGKKIDKYNIKVTLDYLKEVGKLTPETLSTAYTYAEHNLLKHAEVGINAHNVVEEYLRTRKVVKNKYLSNFIDWETESGFKVKKMEVFVHDTRYKFAGTLDLIGEAYGEPILLDLKKSFGVYLSHKLQVAAYKYAFKKKLRIGVLPLGGKNKFWLMPEEEEELYTKAFLHLTKVFHILEGLGEL